MTLRVSPPEIPSVPALDARLEAVISALADRLLVGRPGQVYRLALAMVDRVLLQRALVATRGNQLRAARLLGLNRNTLRKRVRELGLLTGPRRPGGHDATTAGAIDDA